MALNMMSKYNYVSDLKHFLFIFLFFSFLLQKPGAEPTEEDECIKRVDPLHQLILLFSRTALTEKW